VVVSVPISARRHTQADRLGNAIGVLPVAVPTAGTYGGRLAAIARPTADRRAAPRAASAVLLDPGFPVSEGVLAVLARRGGVGDLPRRR